MKNDKKNRRNKISMTQDDYTVRLMIWMMIIVEMMIKMVIRLINTDDMNDDSYKNDDKKWK